MTFLLNSCSVAVEAAALTTFCIGYGLHFGLLAVKRDRNTALEMDLFPKGRFVSSAGLISTKVIHVMRPKC